MPGDDVDVTPAVDADSTRISEKVTVRIRVRVARGSGGVEVTWRVVDTADESQCQCTDTIFGVPLTCTYNTAHTCHASVR